MKLFSSLKRQATGFLDNYKQQSPHSYAAAQQAIGAILITDGLIGIENPFGGKKRSGIFGTIMGMVVGIVFMFMPIIIGNISGINKMTETTQATVVAVGAPVTSTNTNGGGSTASSSCTLTVRYTVGGEEYTKQSSMSSSSNCALSQGQSLTIYYNPANPASWSNDAKTIGFVAKIFFWVGLLMLVSSLVTFVIRLLSIIFGWKILRSGRKLASTLPEGNNLSAMINEIKQTFLGTVFNFGNNGMASAQPLQQFAQQVTQQPAQPMNPQYPQQPPMQQHAQPIYQSIPQQPIQSNTPPTAQAPQFTQPQQALNNQSAVNDGGQNQQG